MTKQDLLFDFFQQGGAAIPKQELEQLNGGNVYYVATEYEAGLCHDPDGPEPINDCKPDIRIIEVNC